MERERAHRRMAAVAAATILASLAVAQPALGLDNRMVFFGSPGGDNFMVDPTNTNPGFVTSYVLRLENRSNATLTQVLVTGGAETPNARANPATPPPTSICPTDPNLPCVPSLPAGASFVDFYEYPDSTNPVISNGLIECAITSSSATSPNDGLRCPVQNLAAGAAVQIRVLIRMPGASAPAAGFYRIWNALQLKEGSSNSGAQPDAFFSVGDVPVTAPDCGAGGVANWFKQNEAIALSNSVAANCAQVTGVESPGIAGQGSFVSVFVNKTNPACVNKLSCFGGQSFVSIEPAILPATAPIVKWTVRWNWGSEIKKVAPKGFIHFHDDFVPGDPSTFDVISFGKASNCPSGGVNCWSDILTDNKTFFQVFIYTEENGSGRGF